MRNQRNLSYLQRTGATCIKQLLTSPKFQGSSEIRCMRIRNRVWLWKFRSRFWLLPQGWRKAVEISCVVGMLIAMTGFCNGCVCGACKLIAMRRWVDPSFHGSEKDVRWGMYVHSNEGSPISICNGCVGPGGMHAWLSQFICHGCVRVAWMYIAMRRCINQFICNKCVCEPYMLIAMRGWISEFLGDGVTLSEPRRKCMRMGIYEIL